MTQISSFTRCIHPVTRTVGRYERQAPARNLTGKKFIGTLFHLLLAAFLLTCTAGTGRAAETAVVRLGLLQFGTVSWEVAAMRDGPAARHNLKIETLPLADKDAAAIALLSGQVDVIVTDWLWVARQRAAGKDYTFVPFSVATGGVLARPAAHIASVADLAGRRLGIGGGPDDKSWLLLQAYARKTANLDLAKQADVQFSAPPALNALMQHGRLDAMLNFWQFNARLQAVGYPVAVSMPDILSALGINQPPPLLGWVFRDSWAAQQKPAVKALLDASFDAKQRLLHDDAAWQKLRPLMQASDDSLFAALKAGYRAGIPAGYSDADIAAARKTLAIMASIDPATAGGLADLPAGTFWPGYRR
jgi:NitT/TauT family transport system substrate-binding protein